MKIGVIMGGVSSERDISLISGKEVINNLDSSKYEVFPIIINKKEDILTKTQDIDFAFIALHGRFGEDGTVQSVLQTLGVPYSGCNSLTSAICMDKDMTKKVLKASEITTAKWLNITSKEELDFNIIENIGYPLFVKPNNGGSSVATTKVNNKKELLTAIDEAFKFDNEVIIEEYIKGDEITCCILDGTMLPVIMIKPTSDYFDYTSKYTDGGAVESIIELPTDLHKKVEALALKCWKVLKCSVYTRVDMLLRDGEPYILELNTLPGMTKNSLFPKSAAGVGMSFPDLLDKIIQLSLKENR